MTGTYLEGFKLKKKISQLYEQQCIWTKRD